MQPKKINKYKKSGPEAEIQKALVALLQSRDWLVIETHGNEFQMGLPDLYCAHYTFLTRWVEVKNAERYCFTPAQMQVFPAFQSKGVGLWILTGATEREYEKLFQPPNWTFFLGKTSRPSIG